MAYRNLTPIFEVSDVLIAVVYGVSIMNETLSCFRERFNLLKKFRINRFFAQTQNF